MLPDFVTTPEVATAHSRITAVELGQICVLSPVEFQDKNFSAIRLIDPFLFSSNIHKHRDLFFGQTC